MVYNVEKRPAGYFPIYYFCGLTLGPMKYSLLFLFLLPLCGSAQFFDEPLELVTAQHIQKIQLRGFEFTFKTGGSNVGDVDDDSVLFIYRGNKQLLSHVLLQNWGDCNSVSVEMGKYFIGDSTLTFYTFWAHMGDANQSPYGARRQVYTINAEGKIKQTEGTFYEELVDYKLGMIEEGALFDTVFSPEQLKAKSLEYLAEAEAAYHAKFVSGAEAEALLALTRKKLGEIYIRQTGDWEESPWGKSMGFRK
jgi:hypothetical protein